MEQARICGGCTACCKTHEVLDISKPSGEWCTHCEISKGCKIYPERPVACREFKCAWLTTDWSIEYRPDKSRLVPDFRYLPGIGLSFWLFEVSEGALESPLAKKWTLNNLWVGNYVMHLPLRGSCRLYVPKERESEGLAFRMASGKEVEIVPFAQCSRYLRPI